MCGLAGIVLPRGASSSGLEERVRRMITAVSHRGPDDSGIWVDEEAGIALGFRRLSIIDLSPAGHQPMASQSGRYTLVFNGEIYNFRRLRQELERDRIAFRGHSDSEVIVAAFDKWGIQDTLPRLAGMFAMAVWDSTERSLTLVRDRLGKKPLFYHRLPGGGALFGQELKSFCSDPAFQRRLDVDSLALYFRYLYVPAPKCIYQNTWKLLPGHLLTIRDAGAPFPAPEPYWRLTEPRQAGQDGDLDTDAAYTDKLESLLTDAVRSRMVSDVPLGALLSGGIDSSTVVALMQQHSPTPVKTYTIGFDATEHDESGQAAAVAAHLGTNHTALQVSGREARELVPSIPDLLDEPLADPSAIPTYFVCKLARQQVTVALTGDGGDEVFAGYNRYLDGARIIRALGHAPAPLRLAAATALQGVGVGTWDRIYQHSTALMPGASERRFPGEKLHKLGALLREPTQAMRYRSLLSAWKDPRAVLRAAVADDGESFERRFNANNGLKLEERMMLFDQGHYLPDDLLAKVDRVSMAVSLEARVPLLDHRIVEFAWRLPLEYKIRGSTSKWLLREVLYRHVPRTLVERPKVGFSVPIAEWLRGPLAPWAEHLLSALDGSVGDLLRCDEVMKAWGGMRIGTHATGLSIWTILGFLAWRERWNVDW